MDCPRCTVELAPIVNEDATISRCAECGGLWVDVGDLNKLLLHANLPAATAIGGTVLADEITGMCPACNVELVVVEGGEKRSLSYDTCESCGGIWVDGEDVDEVPETIAWKDAVTEVVGFFRDFSRKK